MLSPGERVGTAAGTGTGVRSCPFPPGRRWAVCEVRCGPPRPRPAARAVRRTLPARPRHPRARITLLCLGVGWGRGGAGSAEGVACTRELARLSSVGYFGVPVSPLGPRPAPTARCGDARWPARRAALGQRSLSTDGGGACGWAPLFCARARWGGWRGREGLGWGSAASAPMGLGTQHPLHTPHTAELPTRPACPLSPAAMEVYDEHDYEADDHLQKENEPSTDGKKSLRGSVSRRQPRLSLLPGFVHQLVLPGLGVHGTPMLPSPRWSPEYFYLHCPRCMQRRGVCGSPAHRRLQLVGRESRPLRSHRYLCTCTPLPPPPLPPLFTPPRPAPSLTQSKNAWTAEEDEKLRSLMETMAGKCWSEVAVYLPGRAGKQCRERCVRRRCHHRPLHAPRRFFCHLHGG
jgi:hypothetical protein